MKLLRFSAALLLILSTHAFAWTYEDAQIQQTSTSATAIFENTSSETIFCTGHLAILDESTLGWVIAAQNHGQTLGPGEAMEMYTTASMHTPILDAAAVISCKDSEGDSDE